MIRWIKKNQYCNSIALSRGPWQNKEGPRYKASYSMDTILIWCRIMARFSCVGLAGLSATTCQNPMIFLSSVQCMSCLMLSLVCNKYIWQNLVYPPSWKLHFAKSFIVAHSQTFLKLASFKKFNHELVNHPRQAIRCRDWFSSSHYVVCGYLTSVIILW